jgi:hypothetical protein
VKERCSQLRDHLAKESFFQHLPDIRHLVAAIETSISATADELGQDSRSQLARDKAALQATPEWAALAEADRTELQARLDALTVTWTKNMVGLRSLLGCRYELETAVNSIRKEAIFRVTEAKRGREESIIELPRLDVPSVQLEQIERALAGLQEARSELQAGKHVVIRWV